MDDHTRRKEVIYVARIMVGVESLGDIPRVIQLEDEESVLVLEVKAAVLTFHNFHAETFREARPRREITDEASVHIQVVRSCVDPTARKKR